MMTKENVWIGDHRLYQQYPDQLEYLWLQLDQNVRALTQIRNWLNKQHTT